MTNKIYKITTKTPGFKAQFTIQTVEFDDNPENPTPFTVKVVSIRHPYKILDVCGFGANEHDACLDACDKALEKYKILHKHPEQAYWSR